MKDEMFTFRKNALLSDLCKEWDNKWATCRNDKEKLVRLALMQQSLPFLLHYCYVGKGLSKDYLLENFADYINGRYVGIDVDGVEGNYRSELYVGYDSDLSVIDDVLCTMWCNIPSLLLPTCKAAKLYVGCGSDIYLSCEGYNSVIVMLFDNSRITLDDIDEDSTVTIYRYSDKARVEKGKYCLSEKVKIFDKELRL